MTSFWPESQELLDIRRRARAAARRFRLPFQRRPWRGLAGTWMGAGAGASIDFQDHRSYLPGDDPRHINWQVYARTGRYTMKLYREEIRPQVDLLLDASSSMFLPDAKRTLTFEAFFFCVESALAQGAFLRAYVARGDRLVGLPLERLLEPSPAWSPAGAGSDGASALARAPWRGASLRLLVSDCLFPAPPEALVTRLAAGPGLGVVIAPASAGESDPDWSGNTEFLDCEGDRRFLARADAPLLRRYREAYLRHFEAWRSACARRGVVFTRLAAEGGLDAALRTEGLRAGAVEPWT